MDLRLNFSSLKLSQSQLNICAYTVYIFYKCKFHKIKLPHIFKVQLPLSFHIGFVCFISHWPNNNFNEVTIIILHILLYLDYWLTLKISISKETTLKCLPYEIILKSLRNTEFKLYGLKTPQSLLVKLLCTYGY